MNESAIMKGQKSGRTVTLCYIGHILLFFVIYLLFLYITAFEETPFILDV